MTLEDRLERLAHRTAPGDPADILATSRARAESGARRRTNPPRLLPAAAAVVALAAGVMAVVGDNSGTAGVATGPDTPHTSTPDAAGPQGVAGPTVRAEAAGLPTLDISTTPLRPSDAADSGGWVDHTVTMTNTGSDPVHLDDFRTGAVLGDRQVLAATDGCGYGSVLSEPATPACRQNYQPVTIEPGETYQFDITLWRDLEGMNPVTGGSYRWDIEIRVGSEPFADPRTAGGEIATLSVHYDGLAETANDESRADGPDPRGGLDGPVMYAPASHSDRMEFALLTGVLGRTGDCLRLQPPPNVRDPLAELLLWPNGTTWEDDPAGVRLADGTFVPLGAQFTAAGGFHDIDQLVDGGHDLDVAERARSCSRGDIDVVAYVQGQVEVGEVAEVAEDRTVELLWFEPVNNGRLEVTLSYCGANCWFDVDETEEAVTIRAQTSDPEFPPAPDCATAGTVALESPLGSRQVIDAGTGSAVKQR